MSRGLREGTEHIYNILIVDDDRSVRRALSRSLNRAEQFQCDITAVENGHVALAELERKKFDLVLSDYQMPGMNGVTLLTEIRKMYPEMIRILITGHSSPNVEKEAIVNAEIHFYLKKPWDDIELNTIMHYAIERKRVESEKEDLLKKLRQRVKEQSCLYGISKLFTESEKTIDEILRATVLLIPPSWQYPEITCARIIFEGRQFTTVNFNETKWKQTADIIISGKCLGTVGVYYLEKKLVIDEGPFQKEERSLIDAIAVQLVNVILRKQAEEELNDHVNNLEEEVQFRLKEVIQAEKLASIGQLVAGIAHEINSPLTVISLYAQMLDSIISGVKSKQYIEVINTHVDAVSKLVSGLLDFSRTRKLDRVNIDLNESVLKITEVLRHQLELSRISLDLDLGHPIHLVRADPERVQQVIMNIIINAHHSIGRGGKISISTLSDDDETVKLKITDTGKGIPRKYHEKVFEPFYTTKSSGGTGLGLSISRDIITSHNGTIKLDSAEGEGATFTITLPINK